MRAGLPTKTVTFNHKRYRLHLVFFTKKDAEHDAKWWRRNNYAVKIISFDGEGAYPLVTHYGLYYRYKG